MLNETLFNIAFTTTLMQEFHISLRTFPWMVTGFMLVMGIVIPVSVLLLQWWFTTRQLLLGMILIFTVGTVISAAAYTFPILLVGRLIQAAGTGWVMPIFY
ncbi:MFS transporter [Siminovitchia sp. FSL H7-0308]|uniref:MFS family arabinose efflux permease n=1 Tax=Siminovitchia thermophila TaxID=1245522 RepID=A0ABS2R1K2_9BACI|nr:MFS transporter [Siminovitchia thermophila]MBM7713502.1 putative MFS family arabinose efflux permease [Siminovitchia thermophila]